MEKSLKSILNLKRDYEAGNIRLLVCDIQDKFTMKVYKSEEFLKTSHIVSSYSSIIGIKAIVTEQVPRVFGITHKEIIENLLDPIVKEKTSFSMLDDNYINQELKEISTFIIIGIEAHICIFQTAIKLLSHEKNVILIKDAITSIDCNERILALNNLEKYGASVLSASSLLLFLLEDSKNDRFKPCLDLIKKLGDIKSPLL